MKIFVVMLVIAIAFVSGGVSHMEKEPMDANDMDLNQDERGETRPPRVWTIAMSRSFPPMESLDENTMEVVGLSPDVMRAACEIANQKCVFTFHEDHTRCWSDVTQSSIALDSRWIDGCATYNPTPQRKLMYSFSNSYTKVPLVSLFVRNNDNIQIQDLMRDNGISIGFIRGFFTNPACLERNGLNINDDLAQFFNTNDELWEQLGNEQIRMVFTDEKNLDPSRFKSISWEGRQVSCTSGGQSVITRKDNIELLEWLNPAIDNLVKTDKYKKMCYIWSTIFDAEINCL